ncbi:MAG: NPCBM/NEW2 domain-containing protein [Lachnospiraceae bacterium]|nr:NPCBM/NEW2 domain-containing protein [Lachnospiraceae bacterium]
MKALRKMELIYILVFGLFVSFTINNVATVSAKEARERIEPFRVTTFAYKYDGNGSFSMTGRSFKHGVRFGPVYGSNSPSASYNVKKYKKITFVMGALDDPQFENSAELEIYFDKKLYKTYDLDVDMDIKKININTKNKKLMKIVVTNAEGTIDLSGFGIANVFGTK